MDPSEVILWSEVKRGYPSKCERVTVGARPDLLPGSVARKIGQASPPSV